METNGWLSHVCQVASQSKNKKGNDLNLWFNICLNFGQRSCWMALNDATGIKGLSSSSWSWITWCENSPNKSVLGEDDRLFEATFWLGFVQISCHILVLKRRNAKLLLKPHAVILLWLVAKQCFSGRSSWCRCIFPLYWAAGFCSYGPMPLGLQHIRPRVKSATLSLARSPWGVLFLSFFSSFSPHRLWFFIFVSSTVLPPTFRSHLICFPTEPCTLLSSSWSWSLCSPPPTISPLAVLSTFKYCQLLSSTSLLNYFFIIARPQLSMFFMIQPLSFTAIFHLPNWSWTKTS